MAEIPGSQAVVGLKVATTFNTATTITTGDKLQFEGLTPNKSGTVLTSNPLGTGTLMVNNAQRGQADDSIAIDKLLGYNDPGLAAIGQFFGACSVNVLTGTAYLHSIFTNTSLNLRYLTCAGAFANQSVFEMASGACRKMTISSDNPASYIKHSFELLGEDIKTSGATNTWSSVNAGTQTDTDLVVFDQTSEFLINSQSGGALSNSTDRVNITGFSAEYTRAQEHVYEAKGAAGNTTPAVTSGVPLEVMLTVNFRAVTDTAMQFLTAYGASTEFKASITNTSTVQLTGVHYKQFVLNFPRLKVVEAPTWPITSAGRNSFSVKFKALVASANPTGMFDVYPHVQVKNARSTAYSA
jgi:hypothetical protein